MAYASKANHWVQGGKIENTPIGASTPSTGSFTNILASGNAVISGGLFVQGTITSTDSTTVLISDPHLYLNKSYTTTVARTGGLIVNYLPTSTLTTTTGAGVFTIGVAAVSNPTVTVAASAFAAGDLIQISGGSTNDGLYEVESDAAALLTIRGIGTSATTLDFVQNQFANATVTTCTITKVNVSVIRSGTDGIWETGKGSTSTGFTFSDLLSASSGVQMSSTSNTDNAIVRMDTVSGDKVVQDSGILIDDTDNLTIPSGSNLTLTAGDVILTDATTNIQFNGIDAFPVSSTSTGIAVWSSTTGRAIGSTAVLVDSNNNLLMTGGRHIVESSETISPTGSANFNPSANTSVTFIAQGTGSNTGTLGAGSFTNQVKKLVLKSLTSGTYVLTVTNGLFPGVAAGSRTLTFDTAGQSITLLYDGTNWSPIGGGVVVA